METLQAVVALVLGIVVMFFASALVWAVVIAGLLQIIRGKVRRSDSPRPTDSENTVACDLCIG